MAITVQTLDQAIAEAQRFLTAANQLKAKGATYPLRQPVYDSGPMPAQVKRASMDLSRSLSKLRAGE